MNFKDFLLREASHNTITPWEIKSLIPEEVLQLLNKHCKTSLAKGTHIYRGDKSFSEHGNFLAIDATHAERFSRDSNNIYQLMMDSSTELADYPKRTNSIICATSVGIAKSYSNDVYVMIPYDGTRIVEAAKDDFVETYITATHFVGSSVDNMTSAIGGVGASRGIIQLLDLKVSREGKKFTSIEEIDSELAKVSIEKLFVAFCAVPTAHFNFKFTTSSLPDSYKDALGKVMHQGSQNALTQLANYFKGGNNIRNPSEKAFYDYLAKLPKDKRLSSIANDVFTPYILNLELMTVGEKLNSNSEVWFTGKCIAIEFNTFSNFFENEMEKGNYPDLEDIKDL